MAYRRFYRASKPTPRNIQVKYAAPCICCGAEIKAGEFATYYPSGTIAGITEGKLCHSGGLDGTSHKCYQELKKKHETASINDYAGDGLDSRYEDQCRDICGL